MLIRLAWNFVQSRIVLSESQRYFGSWQNGASGRHTRDPTFLQIEVMHLWRVEAPIPG
jgi:hypothetical protein